MSFARKRSKEHPACLGPSSYTFYASLLEVQAINHEYY